MDETEKLIQLMKEREIFIYWQAQAVARLNNLVGLIDNLEHFGLLNELADPDGLRFIRGLANDLIVQAKDQP